MSSAGDEARKKLLRRKKVEQAMEAAFDNDLAAFKKIIEDVRDGIDVPIDPVLNAAGTKQDSFLGEAACGDAMEVVEYCLQKGADVNWIGQNNRTPLQRALHVGAVSVVKPLLEAGADMRLLFPQPRNEDGTVAFRDWDPSDLDGLDCDEEILKILKSWDFNKTLTLLVAKDESARGAQQLKSSEDERRATEFKSAAATLQEEHDLVLAAYKAAVELREVRIKEYDSAKCEGRLHVLDVAESLIKQAEAQVADLKTKVSLVEQKLKATQAKQRQHQVAMQGGIKYDVEISIAQLEDVIFSDVGGHMALTNKVVPFVVDPTGNGLTFLTYRNALLVDIANSHHMHPQQMKLNILGCLRFGKPLLINLRDKPLVEALAILKAKCDGCHPLLYQWLIVEKSIKTPAKYEALIDDSILAENAELNKKRFTPVFTEKFVVALMTQQPLPEEEAMSGFYTVFVAG